MPGTGVVVPAVNCPTCSNVVRVSDDRMIAEHWTIPTTPCDGLNHEVRSRNVCSNPTSGVVKGRACPVCQGKMSVRRSDGLIKEHWCVSRGEQCDGGNRQSEAYRPAVQSGQRVRCHLCKRRVLVQAGTRTMVAHGPTSVVRCEASERPFKLEWLPSNRGYCDRCDSSPLQPPMEHCPNISRLP